MRLFQMRLFTTDADFEAAIERRVEQRIAARLIVESTNPVLLRRAVAAFNGVHERHVPPESKMIAWMGSAIRAFGYGLQAATADIEYEGLGEIVAVPRAA